MVAIQPKDIMNKPQILLLFLLTNLLLPVGLISQVVEEERAPYVNIREVTLFSQYLMEERTVLVYLPSSYDSSNDPYPVVYVTDGDSHIHHLSGIIRFLAGNQLMPDSILVAIPHQNRNADLLGQARFSGNQSGAADVFLSFLKYELMPYVQEHYRTHPFQVLAGHSYGGLFVNYTMVNHPDFFNGYIAADPSLWWDSSRMRSETQTLFSTLSSFDKSYYFDQSEIPNMGGVQFETMLQANAPEDFRWKFVRMSDETHGTIVHKSFYNGLEFVFEDWPHTQVIVSPEGGLYTDSEPIEVSMRHASNGTIRYSNDGSNPTESSAVYSEPFTVSEASIVRASVFLGNNRISIPTQATYSEAVLFESLENRPANITSGLSYERYEGTWMTLPDFSVLQPVQTGEISSVGISSWNNHDNFAVRFSGYLSIPETGVYSFSLASDDGSKMLIDGVELIDNDGLHAEEKVLEYALLEEGFHPLEIQFFERGGDEMLVLQYKGPRHTTYRTLPYTMLAH